MMPTTGDHSFLEATRRELAVFTSDMMGAQRYVDQFGSAGRLRALMRLSRQARLRDLVETSPLPSMLIDPRPGLRIVESNAAYAAATLTTPQRTAGEKLFTVFPDNPATPTADGVSNLFESLHKTAQTGQMHVMGTQRYDVRDANGDFVIRHWHPRNIPIFDDAGQLIYLLHQAQVVEGGDPQQV